MFRVIFVLDIYNSVVVHARRGERDSYEPICSTIIDSSDPLTIIDSLRPCEVYIADLNRLQGRADNLELIKEISGRVRTMCDIGISSRDDLMAGCGTATLILGTETTPFDLMCSSSRPQLATSLSPIPANPVSVSIDIFKGSILARDPHTPRDVTELVRALNECDIADLIVLDMDRVGTSSGFDPGLLADIVDESIHPVILGGGVSDEGDLDALEEIGVSGALVATAIHNGKIPAYRYRREYLKL